MTKPNHNQPTYPPSPNLIANPIAITEGLIEAINQKDPNQLRRLASYLAIWIEDGGDIPGLSLTPHWELPEKK